MTKRQNKNLKRTIINVRKKIKSIFDREASGHDLSHLERVYKYAKRIQKAEGGDLYVISVAAFVHDIHRIVSKEQGHYVAPEDCLDTVKKLLYACEINEEKIPAILNVVKYHDNKEFKNVSLETLVVQDADALDAIGKIGLKRTLMFCTLNNIPLQTNVPLDSKKYIFEINPISACHYLYRTALPNSKNLNTKTANKMARGKIKIIERYIKKNSLQN